MAFKLMGFIVNFKFKNI